MGYQVSTPVFEGPFDLLLHLVTRQQVDIWELSLSSIVDEFVATIERMQALDLSVATEFLLTAAVLLELKARRLLPESSDGEDEEELALWEERDLLLARLLECKTFKDASQAMARLMDASDLSVAAPHRPGGALRRPCPRPPRRRRRRRPARCDRQTAGRQACRAGEHRPRRPGPGERGRHSGGPGGNVTDGGAHHVQAADGRARRKARHNRSFPGTIGAL